MNMRGNVTFVILRNAGSQINQVSFSKRFLIFGGVAAVCAIIAFTMVMMDYFRLKSRLVVNRTMKQQLLVQQEEINNQREQIQVFAEEINSLKSKLVGLNTFEKKIRIIANITKPADDEAGLFGIGGSIPEDLDTSLSIENRHNSLLREMHEQVAGLDAASSRQHVELKEILDKLEEKRNLLACTPSILPAHGRITSDFGYRKSPFTGKRELHRGLDIGADQGTPIHATADGVVSFAGKKGLLGKTVVIDHGHGLSTRYAHCYEILKERGAHVKRGDVIARVGNTGRSTGPHLHYEVRINGIQVNPKKYILNMTAEKKSALHKKS